MKLKKIFMILALLMSLTGCKDSNNKIKPVTVKFNNSTDITFDWGMDHFNHDNQQYDANLALASITLSQSVELGIEDANERLEALTFEHIQSTNYDSTYSINKPAVSFGSKEVSYKGKKKVLIAIVIRGTTDLGDVLSDGYALFDGFDTITNHVFLKFGDYYESLKDYYQTPIDKDHTIVYITGHSLGGAIAGKLGNLMINEYCDTKHIYTYTFASPLYNNDQEPNEYIFNIINDQDIVPKLPSNYLYHRNGNDIIYSKDYGSMMKNHVLSSYLKCLLEEQTKADEKSKD